MENDQELDLELEQQLETGDDQQIIEQVEEDTTDWKAEAAKWRRLAQKKPKSLNTKPINDEIVQDVQFLKTLEAKRQYGYEQGLSPEETDFVFKFAGGKPDKDTLENPFVKSGLEGFRASKKIADNTPSASGSSPVFGNKSFSDLSEDERREAFERRIGR